MGGAASIQDIGGEIAGIDDGDMSNKMQTVLESLKKKGMALTEENFQNEAKVGLNEKDFERAVAMADKMKQRFEGKTTGNAKGGAGAPAPSKGLAGDSPRRKNKKKNTKKVGVDAPPMVVTDDYDVITGLRATVAKVQGFRDAVKKFIGGLDMETVLSADERIHDQLMTVKKARCTALLPQHAHARLSVWIVCAGSFDQPPAWPPR
jgi:hypothetical protein